MKTEDMVAAVQQKLNIGVDGKPGPTTWGAIYKAIVGDGPPGDIGATAIATVDPRSEKNIATLLPKVQPMARELVHKATAAGITIRIISGLRSYAEQDALYAQGRTAPGNKVTNAKGGYSNHNFGIAFDIGVFEGGAYRDKSPKYKAVGVIGMDLGLEWGGNWVTIIDQPHFQLRPNWAMHLGESEMLTAFRERVGTGKSIFS